MIAPDVHTEVVRAATTTGVAGGVVPPPAAVVSSPVAVHTKPIVDEAPAKALSAAGPPSGKVATKR